MATMFDNDEFSSEEKWEKTGKRRRRNTSGMSDNASIENKITLILNELKSIKEDTSSTHRIIQETTQTMKVITHKINEVITSHNAQASILKTLAYKSLDLEARSRRNNLVFWGFMENPQENCFSRVRDMISDLIGVDADNMYISRAHRMGKFKRGSCRPIIVNFRDYCDIEMIMSKAYMLKGTVFSVDRDFPKEISDARKKLWRVFRECKEKYPPSANVQLLYPAKLVCNGAIIKDEFPDWFAILGGDRRHCFQEIRHLNTDVLSNVQISNEDQTVSGMEVTENSQSHETSIQTNAPDVIGSPEVRSSQPSIFRSHVKTNGSNNNDQTTVKKTVTRESRSRSRAKKTAHRARSAIPRIERSRLDVSVDRPRVASKSQTVDKPLSCDRSSAAAPNGAQTVPI